MENYNEVITEFTEDEYKDFFKWLLDKDDISIEKEVDISKSLHCENPYIYYTPEINRFFKTKAMKRLGRIGQLSNVSLDNPNSVHTRLEHSKGAYQNILTFYIMQYQKEDWINKNSSEESKLKILADIMDMASHDIGHNFLSHALENLIDNKKGAHEILGDRIIHENPEVATALKNIHPDLLHYIDLVKSEEYNLHTLKDGNIDFDRADFLFRDSIYLGVEDGYSKSENSQKSLLKILDNIMNGCEIYPFNYKGKDIEVPVFSYEVEPDIEIFLNRRFENYRNIYISKKNKPNDIMLENFCLSVIKNDENIVLEFKDFLNHIYNSDINNIDLNRFLDWDDTRFYNQLFEIIENTTDENLRKSAIGCMPNIDSLISIIYERQMPYITPKIDENGNEIDIQNEFETDSEKEFYLRVKSIINNEFKYSNQLKTHDVGDNYRAFTFFSEEKRNTFLEKIKNGVIIPNFGKVKIDENVISKFEMWKDVTKKYNPKEPIFIKSADGKIHTLDKYPELKLDLAPVETYGTVALLDKMRFDGVPEKDVKSVERLKMSIGTKISDFKMSTRLLSELQDISYRKQEEADER